MRKLIIIQKKKIMEIILRLQFATLFIIYIILTKPEWHLIFHQGEDSVADLKAVISSVQELYHTEIR